MTARLRTPLTLTLLAALLAVCGVVGWRRGRRPSAARLAAMSDPEFAAWVERSGIGTVSRPVAWVEPYGGEPEFV